MLNTKMNHTAMPVTNLQHSDEKSSQKCRCADEECCGIKSQTFLPLTTAHIWKINEMKALLKYYCPRIPYPNPCDTHIPKKQMLF